MKTSLRNEPLLRQRDGAIEFRRLELEFGSKIPNSVHWSKKLDHGKITWKEAEVTRKDFSIVLIHLTKKFFTFEPSLVIQEEIRLIHLHKTMC